MHSVNKIIIAGGLFFSFTILHFIMMWFITHTNCVKSIKCDESMAQVQRCINCAVYTLGFASVPYFLKFSLWEWVISLIVLFCSHWYFYTDHVAFLWAKYIRRPLQMTEPWKEILTQVDGSQLIKVHAPDPKKGFTEFVNTPPGKISVFFVNQFAHLMFLWVLVYLAIARF